VTPPAVSCGEDLWCEDTCCHPCVAPSCEGGWCRIPAGCFVYGSPPDEPGHGLYTEVETPVGLLQDFVIQQFELTRAQWGALGLPMPTQGPYCGDPISPCMLDNCPVDAMNWWESLEVANRISRKHGLAECYVLVGCEGETGKGMVCDHAEWPYASIYECPGYRLPTFAEHQYAIRAGTRTAYHSGDMTPIPPEDGLGYIEDPNLDRIAWYVWNSGNTSHPGGQKEPNGWRLHDMSGNVSEWLWDRESGLGFHGQHQTNPVDWQTTEERHKPACGSFKSPTVTCRSAGDLEGPVDLRCHGVGLRLVRTVTWAEGMDTDTDEWVDPNPDPCDVSPADHDPADCPLGSGWPCSCEKADGDCADGTRCIRPTVANCQDWSFGVCGFQCMGVDGTLPCPGTEFGGEPECHQGVWGEWWQGYCLVSCETEADCPSDQSCLDFSEFRACYPYP
jgi:hypothetical protein